MSEQISFVKAVMQFFNIPTSGAAAEIKKLTKDDRNDLSNMLIKAGVNHTPPAS